MGRRIGGAVAQDGTDAAQRHSLPEHGCGSGMAEDVSAVIGALIPVMPRRDNGPSGGQDPGEYLRYRQWRPCILNVEDNCVFHLLG